jgi:hypothetical protein
MYARQIEETETALRDLRRAEYGDGALAAFAFALSVAATRVAPSFTVPLLLGGFYATFLVLRSVWREWDLIDRLVLDPGAYDIPEVRARAERSATPEHRHSLAQLIAWLLDREPELRLAGAGAELDALAGELDDPGLSLDPACAVACERFLTDRVASPLFNPALPAEDVRAQLRRIRSGFAPLVP